MNENFVFPPEKYFYTVDKKILTNLHQLSSYLKNCSRENFNYHVNSIKNDFYNWINDIFGHNVLSEKIKNINDPLEMSKLIDSFLDSQKENNGEENGEKIIEKEGDSKSNLEENVNENINNNDKNENNNDKNEQVKNEEGRFHEFTDEELEKFAKFGVKDNDSSADEKVDYLKTMFSELKNMIKDLRRSGKDLIIAELMMRIVEPKISYYQFTKKQDDYEKVLKIMTDIKREIEYASQQNEVTLADEIIKQLELQSIMLKKDFTQKKQGVLDKIFKSKEQEV